jgi:hypothetical protein
MSWCKKFKNVFLFVFLGAWQIFSIKSVGKDACMSAVEAPNMLLYTKLHSIIACYNCSNLLRMQQCNNKWIRVVLKGVQYDMKKSFSDSVFKDDLMKVLNLYSQ